MTFGKIATLGSLVALLASVGASGLALAKESSAPKAGTPTCCATQTRCCDTAKACCDEPQKAECCQTGTACCDMKGCCGSQKKAAVTVRAKSKESRVAKAAPKASCCAKGAAPTEGRATR